MDCDDNGVWSYRPRPPRAKATAGENSESALPPSETNNLGEALLATSPPEATATGGAGEEEEEIDRKGLIISFLSLALSIPALIGAWCWPALVLGAIGETVTATARTLGHWVSLYVTAALMVLVGGVLVRAAFTTRYHAPPCARWGPLAIFGLAAGLIMVEPLRHVLTDTNIWPWCGNNPYYDRINSTSGWGEQCMWSATQYVCTVPCCVSTYLPTNASAPDTTSFAWFPPSEDFYPDGPLPGPFATLREDGSLFYPKGFFADATPPYQLYNGTEYDTAPITFYETGELNPLSNRLANLARTDCKYGVNNATGYCLLTDPSLPYEEQLKSLPDGKCSCDGCTPDEDFMHLSVVGVLSTIVCTYTGFALLTIAIGWNANLGAKLKKIPEQWRQLKRANAKRGKVGEHSERLSSDAGTSTAQSPPSS